MNIVFNTKGRTAKFAAYQTAFNATSKAAQTLADNGDYAGAIKLLEDLTDTLSADTKLTFRLQDRAEDLISTYRMQLNWSK